jgi:exodeoxyribonuclease VII small subunit
MSLPADTTPAPAPAPRAPARRAAKPAPAASFRQAYDLLQAHAETLRRQAEPNIDDLLTIVNESVGAYRLCKERIDAVEQALEAALSGAGMDEAEAPPLRPAARASEAPRRAPADADAAADTGMRDGSDEEEEGAWAPGRGASRAGAARGAPPADLDMQDDDIPF